MSDEKGNEYENTHKRSRKVNADGGNLLLEKRRVGGGGATKNEKGMGVRQAV